MSRGAITRWLALAALFVSLFVGRMDFLDAAVQQGPGPGEVTVLDTVTGATCTYTSATPRTILGLPIAVADPGVPLAITGMEVHFVSVTGQAWEDVRIRAQFWDYMNPGLDPIFVEPAGTVQEVSIGARQFITRNAYTETIHFSRPITFETTSFHGVAINVQGRVNGQYVDTDSLTPCLRLGAPFAVGSVALTPVDYGYYRNVYDRALYGMDPFNFLQAEWRSMGSYTALMLKLYAQGPIPTATPTPTSTPTPTPGPPLNPRVFVPVIER